MEDDEARPVVLAPVMLDRMSIGDLEHYVGALRAEIARAEAQIGAKRGHRSAADDLFRFK